jgi:DNA-binding MarR family transcriptional regulator
MKFDKKKLVNQVIAGVRENSIGVVLFHQAVGRILGINITDMKCLDIIVIRGLVNPSQLAKFTGLSTGSTTAMIDRLEKKGLIERRPNPKDRRGTIIVLTYGATKKLPLLFESMARAMERLVSGYSEEELETLSEFFRRVTMLWWEERDKLRMQFKGNVRLQREKISFR